MHFYAKELRKGTGLHPADNRKSVKVSAGWGR